MQQISFADVLPPRSCLERVLQLRWLCKEPDPLRDRPEWQGRYWSYETSAGVILVEPRCSCCARFISEKSVEVYVNGLDEAEVFGRCSHCGVIRPDNIWY